MLTNDEDYWDKLKRALILCKNTIDDTMIIGVTILIDIFPWIDAGYTVHTDTMIYTGGITPMDVGAMH